MLYSDVIWTLSCALVIGTASISVKGPKRVNKVNDRNVMIRNRQSNLADAVDYTRAAASVGPTPNRPAPLSCLRTHIS